MLNISLASLRQDEVRIREDVPPDHPLWEGTELALSGPVSVDLTAQELGDDVLVRGTLQTTLNASCRRCLQPVELGLDEEITLLFHEPAGDEEDEDVGGEVYELPARGDTLDLGEPLREQLLLRAPAYVVCREECRGLCPQCGTNLNQTTCECVPEEGPSPWDALKNLKFD